LGYLGITLASFAMVFCLKEQTLDVITKADNNRYGQTGTLTKGVLKFNNRTSIDKWNF
jgi:hypothetical protein